MPSFRALALPFVLVATIGLTACGDDDDKPSSSSGTTTSSTSSSGDASGQTTPSALDGISDDAKGEVEKIQKDLQEKISDVTKRTQSGDLKTKDAQKELTGIVEDGVERLKNVDGVPDEFKDQIQTQLDQLKKQLGN
ncbi:MAG: hypothetical protein AB7G37_11795 [Solirubrobacteraceae bacterium]